jgi:hypothetical protein
LKPDREINRNNPPHFHSSGNNTPGQAATILSGASLNWEAVGALGEIAGALAVFLTLLYLATQLKQNTASTRASTYSRTTDGWHNYLQSLTVEDVELMIKLASDYEDLSNSEFYRGYYLCRAMFRRMEHDYYQYRAGTFDSETWKAYLTSFELDTFNNPGVRAMWKLQRDFVSPVFRDHIEPSIDAAAKSPQTNIRKRYRQLMKDEEGAS